MSTKIEKSDPFAYAKLAANADIAMATLIYDKSILKIREELEALGMKPDDVSEFIEQREDQAKIVARTLFS